MVVHLATTEDSLSTLLSTFALPAFGHEAQFLHIPRASPMERTTLKPLGSVVDEQMEIGPGSQNSVLGNRPSSVAQGSMPGIVIGLGVCVLISRWQRRRLMSANRRGAAAQARTVRCAGSDSDVQDIEGSSQAAPAATLSDAELMFQQAYEAEAERGRLLQKQVEDALTEKLKDDGDSTGMRISVEGAGPMSPTEPGGRATWREAYDAAKARTNKLEEQLKKARGMGAATASAEAPPVLDEQPVKDVSETASSGTPSSSSSNFNAGPFEFAVESKSDPQGFKKIEDLAQSTIEDEATLRLIAVPVLGRRREGTVESLPPLSQVREVISTDQFVTSEVVEFERVFVFKGAVARSMTPEQSLEALRQNLAAKGWMDKAEVFLQRAKTEGNSVLIVMLKEDLPKNEFAWWQWVLCLIALVATLLSVNVTTFSVTAMSQQQLNSMDIQQASVMLGKTLPTAVSIFATVAAQEVARRIAAAKYEVELTPPFFIPVWPFPSVGCFGAVSRRLGTVPNEEASLAMSTAAGVAGLAVSLGIFLFGLSMGPDPDKVVNLNYQLLPLAFKVLLKPLLGTATVSDQPDPFADPINIAFPANATEIGGIIGLVVVALNLLPIGRLDGGAIIKSIFGSRVGSVAGFLALGLLLLGSAAPNEAGLLCITFGFYSLIFQNGSETPPRDALSQPDDGLKVLGIFLLVFGALFSLPGALLPGI